MAEQPEEPKTVLNRPSQPTPETNSDKTKQAEKTGAAQQAAEEKNLAEQLAADNQVAEDAAAEPASPSTKEAKVADSGKRTMDERLADMGEAVTDEAKEAGKGDSIGAKLMGVVSATTEIGKSIMENYAKIKIPFTNIRLHGLESDAAKKGMKSAAGQVSNKLSGQAKGTAEDVKPQKAQEPQEQEMQEFKGGTAPTSTTPSAPPTRPASPKPQDAVTVSAASSEKLGTPPNTATPVNGVSQAATNELGAQTTDQASKNNDTPEPKTPRAGS